MNIREISKPLTAKALNESLAKRFGKKVALEKFTLEQLQDVRNRVRTTLSQVETNESFNVVQSESYQKNKLFLDVLNAEISEREDIAEANDCDENCPKSCPDCGGTGDPEKFKAMKEAAKPDYIDIDGDGDKEEPMKKAVKDKEKKKKNESIVKEGAEDQAELVMAAKDMVDRLTGWMEDTAEMQTESMLELADAIRDEMGSEQSESFVNSVKPALEQLYGAMETTRQALTQGVGMLTGEAEPMDTMGAEPEADMEPTVDADTAAAPEGDLESELSTDAAAPAAGGEAEAGREKRESKDYRDIAKSVLGKRNLGESSRTLATVLSKKK